jgi:hypothetical protein
MIRKPALILVCSIAVYVDGRHFGWNLSSSRSAVHFNPFAWHLLFFLGTWVALGGAQAVQSIVRTREVFWVAIAYLVFALLVTMTTNSPHLGNLVPSWMLAPFDPNDNLAPYRIVHLIAHAIVVTRFLPQNSPILKWRSLMPLIKCGQNSLPVFCTGIVLSLCARAAIEASLNSLWVQIFVGTLGVLLVTAVAYYGTWPKQRYPILPSPGSNWQNAVPSKSV